MCRHGWVACFDRFCVISGQWYAGFRAISAGGLITAVVANGRGCFFGDLCDMVLRIVGSLVVVFANIQLSSRAGDTVCCFSVFSEQFYAGFSSIFLQFFRTFFCHLSAPFQRGFGARKCWFSLVGVRQSVLRGVRFSDIFLQFFRAFFCRFFGQFYA